MENIKKLVSEIVEKYNTRNPFQVSEHMGIIIQEGNLEKLSGCHLKVLGQKLIYVNSTLDYVTKNIVAAHELGHALLNSESCYFFSWGDEFYKNKAEIEAHTFAAELLIPDDFIIEHPGYTISQLATLSGYTERLLSFKKI